MTEFRVTYWRDLPSLVTARDGEHTAKASLDARFMIAIDEAAMRLGATVVGLVALLCRGHVLLEGPPGVAKTSPSSSNTRLIEPVTISPSPMIAVIFLRLAVR